MKRFILLCICVISSVVVFAQLKEGSEYIYFYKEIDKPNIIACYFSANKVYFRIGLGKVLSHVHILI